MDLEIVRIKAPGTEDERILMRAVNNCNLGDYLVYDETFDDEGNPSNLMPHMLRFDNLYLEKGEHVSLRTQGNPHRDHKGTLKNSETVCYYLYWGLDETIFNQEGDTIHLIQIDDEEESSY